MSFLQLGSLLPLCSQCFFLWCCLLFFTRRISPVRLSLNRPLCSGSGACQPCTKSERKTSSNGKSYFNLKAANGQIIGTSEMYESESSGENGIASVKSNAPSAAVDDQSN
ncbi:MAG TPA: YegP family protein [Puia sp.]|nr:YegP family protein [Puia sp.]